MILHSKITPEHPQTTPEQHHAFGTFLQPKRSYSLVDLAYYKQKNNKQKIRVYSALVYSKPEFDNPIFVTELQILEID